MLLKKNYKLKTYYTIITIDYRRHVRTSIWIMDRGMTVPVKYLFQCFSTSVLWRHTIKNFHTL